MHDCLIIGGGVIGLSLAYELSGQGRSVCLLDRREPGREASWAGAGMLPPGTLREQDSPYQQLAGLAHQLHPHWAADLREQTGIDTGFRRSGAIYVARDGSAVERLTQQTSQWKSQGIRTETLDAQGLAEREPHLNCQSPGPWAACLLSEESQLRNPHHLKALITACLQRGVEIQANVAVQEFRTQGGRLSSVVTASEEISAGQFCLTAGCWSGSLARQLGFSLAIEPVRGQIVLLRCGQSPVRHIINEGPRYLVPRPDGRVLIGSTEERAGFECRTTATGLSGLIDLGLSLCPALGDVEVERAWAGLRPGSSDGLPYMGQLPELDNAYLAAGHFRSGLRLSPAVAVVMRELLCGEAPQIDLSPFRLDRE